MGTGDIGPFVGPVVIQGCSRSSPVWRLRRIIGGGLLAILLVSACGGSSGTTSPTTAFDGCQAGAGSVMTFLQRTLDRIGDAEPGESAALVPDFDEGVRALLLRAQEVHCTEVGFNDAVIARVDELEGGGGASELLIEMVRQRGLGSLEHGRGGPITLPAG